MNLTDEEKRHKRKAWTAKNYDGVDWTKSNAEIAKDRGCRISTIWHARKRLGIAKVNTRARETIEVDAKMFKSMVERITNENWNKSLNNDETRIIEMIRKRPEQLKHLLNLLFVMDNQKELYEKEHVANCTKVMNLLGISHDRSEDNALKKGAAMAFLRANGWTHYGAQRAVGLTCRSAGMSIRSTRLHGERMKNNLYKVTFSEVERKLGEWLRKKNKTND